MQNYLTEFLGISGDGLEAQNGPEAPRERSS
jgi:hypothetical protein